MMISGLCLSDKKTMYGLFFINMDQLRVGQASLGSLEYIIAIGNFSESVGNQYQTIISEK